MNAAFYCVERRALERYRELEPPLDFAKDLFPRMLADGARLHGYRSFEYIKDVGTPARVDKAERDLLSGAVARARRDRPQAAVFLDRDGVLNELRGYVRTPEELVLIPGAAQAVRSLNQAGLRAVVVTNQPVLARGECTLEALRPHPRQAGHRARARGRLPRRALPLPAPPAFGIPGRGRGPEDRLRVPQAEDRPDPARPPPS